MNSEGQQLSERSAAVQVTSGHSIDILVDKRTRSAPYSDYINNRNMGVEQGTPSENGNISGRKNVENWLENSESPLKRQDTGSEDAAKEEVAYSNDVHHSTTDLDPQATADSFPEVEGDADIYQEWLLQEEAKIREKAFQGGKRFCVQDIVGNPDLEIAAIQEMTAKHEIPAVVARPVITPQASNAESVISLADSRVSRLENMLSISENLDRDADKDMQGSTVDLANLLERIKLGRSACVDLLNFVQRLYKTETMYTAALLECSRPNMASIGQTPEFRDVTESFCELPMKVRQAHTSVAQSLAGSVSSLDEILVQIKHLIEELEKFPSAMKKDMSMKKIALTRSKFRHAVLCKRLEKVNEETSAGVDASSDPWFTEGQVAHNYTQLIQGQANIRKCLSDAYKKATDLEEKRLDISKKVLESLLNTYGTSISDAVRPFMTSVCGMLEDVGVDLEIEDLRRSSESSQRSEQLLRAQCSDEELIKCAEIFHSPDIVRQGTLQVLDKDDIVWMIGHFVLTKSGLYWFLNNKEGSRPDDYISLCKTDLQQVKAPLFKLVEQGNTYFSGRRSIVLKAPTIEECCSWTVDIREAISSSVALRK